MTSDSLDFSDVRLFWELDGHNHLTIAISAPVAYLRHFSSPSDILFRFLTALQAQGIGVAHTAEVRTRINTGAGSFFVRWTGLVNQNPELVQSVMPALAANLGVRDFGS